MGGIPTELRIYINTMAAKALQELRRVEQLLLRIRRGGMATPVLTTAVSRNAYAQVTQLSRQLENLRAAQSGRPPPLNTAVSRKAFAEIAALNQQYTAMRANAAAAATASVGATAAAGKSATSMNKVAAAGAGAAAVMSSGAKESTTAMKSTGNEAVKTGGIMGRFMAAQNSRLRAFGSEVQWTGRQMQHHLTMPFILMGAFAGKTWFDQEDMMTAVVKVYGDAGQSAGELENEIEALRNVATKLSETFGRNREEVLEVAEAWAVAGSSGIALAESMNLTMQASVLGNMESAKAAEMLIAIQAQYGASTEELTKILAQINYASNNTALTIEQLGAGFQRSAAIARTSGMDAANLAGMIATIAPAAGTAEQAGNGLRMIMTRIQSQTSDTTRVIEYMNESLGDQMISMKEFYGLPMEEKLMHLAAGYNELDRAQRTQASSMIAGAHQSGRMDILLRELNNLEGYYHKTVNQLQDDTLVAEVMFRELTKNLTSDPRRIQQAWQKFRNAMAEVFVPLIPIVTYFINAIGDMVKGFTNLNPGTQKFIVGIGLALAMIGPLITAMGVVALTAVQLKPMFQMVGGVLYWLSAGPVVALIKGMRNLAIGIFATGETANQLGPKMKFVNVAVGNAAQGITKTLGGLFSRMSSWYVGQNVWGFASLDKRIGGFMSSAVKSVRTGYQSMTAESAAAQTVDAAIHAEGWARRRVILIKEWVQRNLLSTQGIRRLLGMEAAGQASQTTLALNGSQQRLALEAGESAKRAGFESSAWARKWRIFRTGSDGITRMELSFADRMRALTVGRTKQVAVIESNAQVARTAATAQGASAQLGIEGRKFIASERVYATGEAAKTAITAGGTGSRLAIEAGGQAQLTAVERAGYLVRLRMWIAENINKLALAIMGEKAHTAVAAKFGIIRNALVAKFTAAKVAIETAGSVRAAAIEATAHAVRLASTRAFWVGMLATTFSFLGKMAAGIWAAMTGPIGLAILAGVAIFVLFGDKIAKIIDDIKAYFQNLPEGVRQGLQPIVNLWNNVVNGIASVWNRLPRVIQAPLEAVWNMIASAMRGIRKLLNFMNPFQRQSPSLVDNVNAGMDVIGSKFQSTANSVQGHVNSMSAAVAGLRSTFAQLDAMNAANERAKNIETIRTAGVGDVDAQIAAYEQVEAQVRSLQAQLGPLNQRISQQERVVASAAAAVERAEANIKSMNAALDEMRAHADAVSASLEAARERLHHFSSATIAGMGAVDDALFENEMAQKSLQLQIAQLEEAAGVATGGASDHFARLQGDIENLSGQRMDLHFGGAGSDITDVYKQMEDDLRGQQLTIGSPDVDSGPAAEIAKLQDQLDALDRKATIMDLEKSLKFDPLTRQIEAVTDASHEIPFEQIMSGLRSSQAEVTSLERTYESATRAMEQQEAAIKQAEAARDVLSARHSEQEEALQELQDSYSSVEEAIREGESALGDMTSAAETAIRHVEELARAQEEAARAAERAATGGRAGGGAGGAGGGGSTSPRFSSFLEAEGAEDYGDPGGGATIGRDFSLGTDQSELMEDFNPLEGMDDLDELIGSFDMLSPFKNAWQKVVDWWNNTVFPMKNPLGDMFGDVGDIVAVNLGGETMNIMDTFKGWWESLVNIWDTWIWPALQMAADFFRNSLRPVIENLGNVFTETLGPALERIGERFVEMWPHIKTFVTALWEVGRIILGFLIGKALLKWITIFTVLWGVLMVGINMISHMLVPVINWLADMIEVVILIVQGLMRYLSGLWNYLSGIVLAFIGLVRGIFTGDWTMFKDAIDRIIQGVKDMFGGVWDILDGIGLAIYSTFYNALHLIWNTVWGFVEGIIDFFYSLYETVVGNSIIPDMVNAIVDWFLQLPMRILGVVANLVSSVVEFFWSLITTVVGAVAGFVVDIVTFYVNLYTDVIKWVAGLVGDVIGWFRDMAGKVVGWVSGLVKDVVNFYRELPGRVFNALSSLASRMRGAFQTAFDYLRNLLPGWAQKVLDFYASIPGKIWDKLKSIATVAKDFVEGFWNGIKSMGSWLADKVKSWVSDNITDPIKSFLGISSPSTVAAGFGADTAEGMAQGIESGGPGVTDAVHGISDDAVTAAGDIPLDTANAVADGVDKAGPVVDGAIKGLGDIITYQALPAVPMTDVLKEFNESTDAAHEKLGILTKGMAEFREEGWQSEMTQQAINDTMRQTVGVLEDFDASMIQSSGQIDSTTEAGSRMLTQIQDVQTAFDDAGAAAYAYAIEQGESTEMAAVAAMKASESISDDFIAQAEAAGIPIEKAQQLIETYGMVPKDVLTRFGVELDEADEVLEAWMARERSIEISAEVAQRNKDAIGSTTPGHHYGGQYSQGGWVSGAGTSTSDDVPAMLSDREFVVRAAMAKKYAGILEQINAGTYEASSPTLKVPELSMSGGGGGGMPDIPSMDVPDMPEMPEMSMPEMDTELAMLDTTAMIEDYLAFDAEYQLLVQQHTDGVEGEYGSMFDGIEMDEQQWSAEMLLDFTNLTLQWMTVQTTFMAAATTAFAAFYTNLTALTTTAFANISSLFVGNTNAWLSLISSFISALLTAWTNMINQLVSLLQGGVNNLTNMWQGLANNFNKIFSDGIKPVFDAFLPMLETLEGWFRSTVDNIGSIWGEVEPKTAGPARFVINEVYNDGLRSAWNSFNEFLDLPELPPYTAKFRDGGSVDFRNGGKAIGAGTGTSDSIPAYLSNGEHVITAREVQGAGGHHAIEAQRSAWRKNQSFAGMHTHDQVHAPYFRDGGPVQGFAEGGRVRRLPGNQYITTPIQWAMHDALATAFPGASISSGTRYQDVGAGYDYHMQGMALDIVGPMNQVARWIERVHGRTALELIHAPEIGFRNLWNGRPHTYSAGTMGDHYDHVHWATNVMVGSDGKLVSAAGGSGPIMIDYGEIIGDAFDESLGGIKDPGFGGGIGQWVPKSIEKARLAEAFMVERAEEMGTFLGDINDADGMVERWRPMVIAALKRNGFDPSLRNQNLMLAQISTESGGIPDRLQEVIDINSGGNEALGLLQIAKGTWPGVRDPSLPDDRTDPWANMNAALRYYKGKYGMDLGLMWGKGHGYDKGGVLPPTPGGFGTYYNHTGGPEAVLTKPQWDNIYRAADSQTRLSYEDIVRAFKAGHSSPQFDDALDKGIVRKIDPRWEELERAVYDAADTFEVVSDEQTESWVEEFQKVGNDVKDFFAAASEFYTDVTELTDFLASDEFWDKVKENSGEAWGKAEEALDHLHWLFAGFSFVAEREALAAEVGDAVNKAAATTVDAIEDAELSEAEREEARIKREEEAAQDQKAESEKADFRDKSLMNGLSALLDQRLTQVNESIARVGAADIFSLGQVFETELGHLTGIANETFGSVENAGHIANQIGSAVNKLVFDNFNLTGAIEDIRAAAGQDGQIPMLISAAVEALDEPENRAMVLQLEEYGKVVIEAIGQTLAELDFGQYYAPLINKMADWIEKFPEYQKQQIQYSNDGFGNALENILLGPLNSAANLLGGIYNLFTSLAPTLLRHGANIGGTLSAFANSGTGALGAIMTAVVTGNPMALIPHIPQLLAVGLELIPQVIDAIIDIVPLLIEGVMNLVANFFRDTSAHGTAEEALQASIEVSKKLDETNDRFYDGGGTGGGDDPQTWRPEGASGNQNNFYGDLSFPNVTNEDDAKGFIENLSRL